MSEIEHSGFFLGRRPILTAERRLVGWQLALASGEGECLTPREATGPSEERSRRLLAAAQAFIASARWPSLLGGARALLPVDRRLLLSDVLDGLPRNRFLLGLAADAEIDPPLARRLHELHDQRGTRLLFFDYARRDPREQLLELADGVQIDAFDGETDRRTLLLRRAKRRNLQVMADAVAHDADFERLRAADFDLFVGSAYAEASKQPDERATEEGRALLRLLVEARGELEIDDVTARIEAMPGLTAGLLRLVNSLELARAQKIGNVGQALIMIGARGLSRWLLLLLFQVGNRLGTRSPLFRVAASRARLMELVAAGTTDVDVAAAKESGEAAFLTGILSFVHVLLGGDRRQAMSGLTIAPEIKAALEDRAGPLGRLLRLVECLDEGHFAELAEIAREQSLSPVELWQHQQDAYEWVTRIG